MFFPIMIFAIIGYEHCIANMAFIPLGFMNGADAVVDYRKWLYGNFILAVLGNIVGGGFIIGGSLFYLFNWTHVPKTKKAEEETLLHPHHANAQCEASPFQLMHKEPSESPSDKGPLDPEKARKVFGVFDDDRDGLISLQQATFAMGVLGYPYPIDMFRSMVPAGRSSFDYQAFEALAMRVSELEDLGLSPTGPLSVGFAGGESCAADPVKGASMSSLVYGNA
jgi:hypothetical protein